MSDYDRTSIDLRAWLRRPKRGYTAELTREGLVLSIMSRDYGYNIVVRWLAETGWRRSVARHLAYLRSHVRQQARQWRQMQARAVVS